MRLQPGDRRIATVSPDPRVGLAPEACQRCGSALSPVETWEVEVREGSEDLTISMIVCGVCADRLHPVRISIDLSALERERSGHERLRAMIEEIRSRRRSAPEGTISVRASDVMRLAEDYGTSSSAVATALLRDGLAAATTEAAVPAR